MTMSYEMDLYEEQQAEIDRLQVLIDIKDRQIASTRAEALEEAAHIAGKHEERADKSFAETVEAGRNGKKNIELAAAVAVGMSHTARGIAADIRALIAKPQAEEE